MRKIKNITFLVSDEFHTKVKIQVAKKSSTLKDYIIALIEKDLKESEKQEKE